VAIIKTDVIRPILVVLAIGVCYCRAETPIKYTELLQVEWGQVRVIEQGTPSSTPEDAWFVRQPPTFSSNNVFDPSTRSCLASCFQTAMRNALAAEGEHVYCIDGKLVTFSKTIVAEQCVRAVGPGVGLPPKTWAPGTPKTLSWSFWFQFLPNTNPPASPNLEIDLLIEGLPRNQALEVSLPDALRDSSVVAHLDPSEISPQQRDELLQCTNWARLFLVGPLSPADTNKIQIVEPADTAPFAIPISYGIVALHEALTTFTAQRLVTPSRAQQVTARMSPDSKSAFPWCHYYFPEADLTLRSLKGAESRTGIFQQDLFRLDRPPLVPGFRVQTNANLILIRAGPFHSLQRAAVNISRVQGQTNGYTLEELKKKLKDKPDAYGKYLATMTNLEVVLTRIVNETMPATNQFFWLPAFEPPHARIMSALTDYRFSAGIQAAIKTNQFVYDVIFAPAWGEGTLGASYDPNHGLGISAGLNVHRLWKANDSLHVQATVAQNAIQGDLGYDVDYHHSLDDRTTFHLNPFGSATHDEKFRLGSLSSKPFRLQEESGGIGHEIQHYLGDHGGLKIRDEIFWQDYHLDPQQQGLPGNSDNGLRLHHQQFWSWNIPAANHSWHFNVSPAFDYAPEVGWANSFWVADLGASVRLDFAGDGGDSMYLALSGSTGTASKNVPPVSLFRLGDVNRLFGLEPGEFSGRSYSHAELDYGIGVGYLLGRLIPKMRDETNQPAALAGVFLVVLTEFGSVANSGDFHALHDPDSTVSSYGAAFEKTADGFGAFGQRLGFRIGYAYSPDSVRTGGRFFTAAVLNF
jgi:hypothetical protein